MLDQSHLPPGMHALILHDGERYAAIPVRPDLPTDVLPDYLRALRYALNRPLASVAATESA